MTEPDEACLTAAQVLYDNLECRLLSDESTNKEHRRAERDDLASIARALMAERERAKAEERERCANVAEESSFGFDVELWLNSTKKEMTAHTARAIAAAIRKGEHHDAD